MVKRGLVVVALLVLVAVPAGTAPAQERAAPVVEAARQVTDNPAEARAHATPAVAVHPSDPDVVAIGEADGFSSQCFLHVSTDAGLSWRTSPIEQRGEWSGCVYSNFGPIVDLAFASDGTLYYAYSGFNPKTYHQRIFLARTDDLGRTFQTTALPWVEPNLQEGQFGADALPSIAVDPGNPDRVYVGWMTNNGTWNLSSEVMEGKKYYYDVFSRPYLAVSEDGGRTFRDPIDLAEGVETPGARGWMNEPHVVAGENGTVFAFFGENVRPLPEGSEEPAPPAHLFLASSSDGGRTFTTKAIHTRERKPRDWLGQPSPGIDLETGNLYVVWDEQPEAEGIPHVAFMRSTDGGRTWTGMRKLNDVAPKRDWNFCEFCPSLDVAPSGRIDVVWYDWRNDVAFSEEEGTNRLQDVYYTYSTDGGVTWSENIRVTDRSIDRRVGAWDAFGLRGHVGLASTDESAVVAWDDSRNGDEANQAQDVYLTRVRLAAAAAEASGESRLLVGAIGAGLALTLGGLVLLIGTRVARRTPAERAGAAIGVGEP